MDIWLYIGRDIRGMEQNSTRFDEESWAPLWVRFFALSANASLLLGGDLKRLEFISGRYADLLSYCIAGYVAEWHAKHSNAPSSILDAFRTRNMFRIHTTAKELAANHPHSMLHRAILYRTIGSVNTLDVTDKLKTAIAAELQTKDLFHVRRARNFDSSRIL